MAWRSGQKGAAQGRVIIIALLILAAAGWAGWTRFFAQRDKTSDVQQLIDQAENALEAVKNRKPGERRPPSYDQVMTPLDKLLAIAKTTIDKPNYDSSIDFNQVNEITNAVIDIAHRGFLQAQTETGLANKPYRFPDQEAEACRYRAIAMWRRLEIRIAQDSAHKPGGGRVTPLESEATAILQVVQTGIDAQPRDAWLWYIKGLVNRSTGAFASASQDLQKAVEIEPDFAPAWNTLGLVYIHLKQFDQAEEAYTKAKDAARKKDQEAKVKPGPDYSAAVYNLGVLHGELTGYYASENRRQSTPAGKAEFNRHRDAAINAFNEYTAIVSPGDPDLPAVKRMQENLKNYE